MGVILSAFSIILAGGKGSRMGDSRLPKALQRFRGHPLLWWLVRAINNSYGIRKPVIVVGYQGQQIQEVFGPGYAYPIQDQEGLGGTGAALQACIPWIRHLEDNTPVLVCYTDQPCIMPQTLDGIVELYFKGHPAAVFATTRVSDFEDWRRSFQDFGRVIRDKDGRLAKIVEAREAIRMQLSGDGELNVGIYCFRASWLQEWLSRIPPDPETGELYITWLVKMAAQQGEHVVTFSVPPEQAVGVNSPEDMLAAENLAKQEKKRKYEAVRKYVHMMRERDNIQPADLGYESRFEPSCISRGVRGEARNLIDGQLMRTHEGHGDWLQLEDPIVLEEAYIEVCERIAGRSRG
ncbi:MAG: NTP transferase domain-containing protein [Candidatus Wildermuthbacteria bacterium]|nr:NTP transferase domain-containing protein [Candidatus Wildermuthbacteria bacterium]